MIQMLAKGPPPVGTYANLVHGVVNAALSGLRNRIRRAIGGVSAWWRFGYYAAGTRTNPTEVRINPYERSRDAAALVGDAPRCGGLIARLSR